jgi:hypothetical protein
MSTEKKEADDKRAGEQPQKEQNTPDAINASRERLHVDPDTLSTTRKTEAEIQEEHINEATGATTPSAESDLKKEDYKDLGPQIFTEDEALKVQKKWPEGFEEKEKEESKNPHSQDQENLRK